MIELRLLSLFVERAQAGRLGCGRKVSERVIIDDNRLVYADFSAIRENRAFAVSFRGENATFAPLSAHLGARLGLPISLSLARARACARVPYI